MPENTLRRYFDESAPTGVVAAWLFGSRAEGRAHRESDVDVAMLVDHGAYPTRADRDQLRIRVGADLIGELHENRVDVIVLNDVSPELAARVVDSGRRVFCADPVRCDRYALHVRLRASDLARWLERMRRIKLEAIRR